MYRMTTAPEFGDFRWNPEKRHQFMQISRFLQLLNQLRDFRELNEDVVKPVRKSPRQVLLDAVAFVSCSDRKSGKVSAVTMETLADGAGIRFRIAMNEGVPEPVLDGLRVLGKLLTDLSNGKGTEFDIFSRIVQLKQNNLKNFLTTFLLKYFDKTQEKILFRGQQKRFPSYSKALQATVSPEDIKVNGPYNEETHEKHMAEAWKQFMTLHQLCRDAVTETPTETILDLHTAKLLILSTWEIRHMRCFRYFLSYEQDTVARTLVKLLRKLCKYIQSSVNLVKAARASEFAPLIRKKLLFATIPMLPPLSPPAGAPDSLATFLMSLGYRIDDLHRYCSKTKQPPAHIAKRFEGLSKMTNTVHAEVRLVFFYSLRRELHPSPEIGSSKHACYLCHLFVKHHPYFTVPETHKVIYCGWSFPAFPAEIPVEIEETIRKMMVEMEKGVNEDFMVDPRRPMCSANMPPLSTSGVSESKNGTVEPFIGNEDGSEGGNDTPSEEEMERSGEFDLSGSDTLNEFMQGEGSIESTNDAISTTCAVCNNPTTRRCTFCNSRYYCTEKCQHTDSRIHAFNCTPGRPIDSADHVARLCLENCFPADSTNLSGFGFDRCRTAKEWAYLLRLYFGLVKYLNVTSQDLRRWRLENTLADNIQQAYNNTEFANNASYKWFLLNRHILDVSAPKKSPFDQTQLSFLSDKDVGTELNNLRPIAKRDAAILYMELNSGWHPHPREHLWMDFGFSTCPGEFGPFGELELAKFYRVLIAKCSFNQFWKAHESRTLERLARKKGFGERVKYFNDAGVRIGFPRAAPGVYTLKRYILNKCSIVPPLSVVVEYGLCNCMNVVEKQIWAETYGRLIEAPGFEAMELQNACDRGAIWEYTRGLLSDVHPVFERLCANPKKYGK